MVLFTLTHKSNVPILFPTKSGFLLDELGKDLKIIEGETALHGALKKGFMAICGYGSDEDGIRHAMLDEPQVGF